MGQIEMPEGWSPEMWAQYLAFMGDVFILQAAAQVYAEELSISPDVANHEIATNWSLKQAKAYLKRKYLEVENSHE